MIDRVETICGRRGQRVQLPPITPDAAAARTLVEHNGVADGRARRYFLHRLGALRAGQGHDSRRVGHGAQNGNPLGQRRMRAEEVRKGTVLLIDAPPQRVADEQMRRAARGSFQR